jgi:DNA-binding MarR family transcriptional regulator
LNLENHIGLIMTKSLRKMNLLFNHEFNQFRITSEQWSLLKCLDEGGITVKDITQAVGKDQGNVTRILDLLVKRGLVKRRSNPNDGRSSLVYLTEEGKGLMVSLIPIDEKIHNVIMEGLSEEEKILFNGVISKFNQNVNEYQNLGVSSK